MLRNYVNENQDDWDRYAEALTYAYNNHVHRSIGTTPFDLVLSRPPPEFSLHHSVNPRQRPTVEKKADFVIRLDRAIEKAYASLTKAQARYKKDYDRSVRRSNKNIRAGDWIYLDNPEEDPGKLEYHTTGPHRVIANDGHTLTIDRAGQLERVSSDRLVAGPPPAEAPSSVVHSRTRALPEGVTLSQEEYVVDKILDDVVDEDGHRWFKVRYYGYNDTEYQPEAAIPAELTSQYLRRKRRSEERQERAAQAKQTE